MRRILSSSLALPALALVVALPALAQGAGKPKPAADKPAATKPAEKPAAKPAAEKPAAKADEGKKADGKKADDTPAVEKAAAKKPKGKNKIAVTWLGHAAFVIVSPGGTKLLIDPFLSQNPSTPAEWKDLSKYKPDAILVSHSHQDHMGDAEAIAKASGAKVIGAFELVGALKVPDPQKMGGNVGGHFKVGDATIHLVPAMHGSEPGGRPLGFVVEFDNGKSVYHTGDTWIFSDMKLIQDLYKPDILLLNAGGGPFTQSPDVAKLAVRKFFRPKAIIPMHYGTFPPLATEDDVKKAFGKDRRVKVMKPGETQEL